MTKVLTGLILLVVMGALLLLSVAGVVGQRVAGALASVPIPNNSVAQVSTTTKEVDGVVVQIENNHGDKHVEAALVRSTCQQNGTYQVWREPDKQTFHRLCLLPDGRFGDWIVKLVNGVKYEKSAFIPKDGSWGQVVYWLASKGATRFTSNIFGH